MSHASRKQGHGRASSDRWLVSYADFITLLFAFFATLYAISSVDSKKLQAVAVAMQDAFDTETSDRRATAGGGVLPADGAKLAAGDRESSEQIQAAVSRDLAKELKSHRLDLIVDRRGVILSIPEAGTFSTGRDELSEQAQALMAQISVTVARFRSPVRVEGHTDDIPIHTMRFQSNWDLSAARASRVVEYLIAHGIGAGRLSATGYGEFHPRVVNDSDRARASNRRVDLVILNAATNTAEEPAAPQAP